MLTRGEDLPGQPVAHGHVRVVVVRQQVFLDPFEPVRTQHFGEAHGVLDVERHPAIQHQFAIVANLLARPGHELSFFRKPSRPSAGP